MLVFLEKKGQTLGPTAPFKAESCTAENVPQHREASASPQSTGTCLLQPPPHPTAWLGTGRTDTRLPVCSLRSRVLSQGLTSVSVAEGRVCG